MALESTDQGPPDVNPYASSAILGGPPIPGVGAWREGSLLVMHKAAELPRICIHTGEPAAGAREFRLVYKCQGDLLSQGAYLYLPLRFDLLRSFARQRRQSLVGLVLAALVLVVMFSLPVLSQLGDWVFLYVVPPGLALGFIGVALWWANYRSLQEPLKLVHAAGDYLWFAGLHLAFLDRLPHWPRVDGPAADKPC